MAAEPLFRAIPVKYTGLYSDDHLIDLQEFGISLQGLARLSNSVVDFYLNGRVAKDSKLYQVRLFAAPPEPGCVILDIVAILNAGQLPLYAKFLCDVASEYIIPLIKATIAKRLKRPDMEESALNQIVALATKHAESMDKVHEGHMVDKAWLQGYINKLSGLNSGPLRQLVSPIGSTCRQIEFGSSDSMAPVTIGEAEAQALSAREQLSVEDAREFRGVFEGVDRVSGICKFRPHDSRKEIVGKITDPALINALNVYTHSLDTQKPVAITAKAVTKDDEVVKLYISDGHEI